MANQDKIDKASEQIANLVDSAKAELIQDLYKIGNEINNTELFIEALTRIDVKGTLRQKLTNATSFYTNAHRDVLESTIGFADLQEKTLNTFISLNQELFDDAIVSTISSHIKNKVVRGLEAGLNPRQIIEQVTNASISNAQMQTLVNTTLNSYSRTITNQMMDIAPDNAKYVYIGPADEKTREECLKYINAGRLTKQQIIDKQWRESLTEGGGFNCRHKWEIASEEGTSFYEEKEAKELTNAG